MSNVSNNSQNRIDGTSGQDIYIGKRSSMRYIWVMGGSVVALGVILVWAVPAIQRFLSAVAFYERDKARYDDVRVGRFERSFSVQGKIVSSFSPKLFASQDGNVFLLVSEGEHVDKGDRLARIDNAELESRLHQEEAALKLLEVELGTERNRIKQEALERGQKLELLRINLGAEQRELTRMEKIVSSGGVSENDFERANDKVHALEVQVNNTAEQNTLVLENHLLTVETKKLTIEQKNFAVEDLRRQVEALQIISPVDGVVGDIEVNERDLVTRNQPILSVIDLSAYEIEVLIPETYAESLEPGLAVEVTYRGRQYFGALRTVSPEVKDGSVAGRVEFKGDAPSGLRQNLRVNNKIIIEARENALIVKRGPFIESHGGRGIYVVEGDVATYRTIAIGAVGVNEVEIVDGLEAGERVIVSDTSEFFGSKQVLLTD